jgi:hypothetical protein
MKRDFIRVFRAHGIKVFALPVCVVLVLAVLADQWLGDYLSHREEATELQDQLLTYREILSLDSKIHKKHEEIAPEFATLAQMLHTAPDAKASGQAMQEQLRALLQSLHFGEIEFEEITTAAQGSVTFLHLQARFTSAPQQLPRLHAALTQSPTIVTIDQLEVRVVEDAQRSVPQLAVSARFKGLHMPPLPKPPAASATQKTQAKL